MWLTSGLMRRSSRLFHALLCAVIATAGISPAVVACNSASFEVPLSTDCHSLQSEPGTGDRGDEACCDLCDCAGSTVPGISAPDGLTDIAPARRQLAVMDHAAHSAPEIADPLRPPIA